MFVSAFLAVKRYDTDARRSRASSAAAGTTPRAPPPRPPHSAPGTRSSLHKNYSLHYHLTFLLSRSFVKLVGATWIRGKVTEGIENANLQSGNSQAYERSNLYRQERKADLHLELL